MNRTYCGAGVGILYAMVVVGLIAIVIAVVVIALFTHDSANGENPFQ